MFCKDFLGHTMFLIQSQKPVGIRDCIALQGYFRPLNDFGLKNLWNYHAL